MTFSLQRMSLQFLTSRPWRHLPFSKIFQQFYPFVQYGEPFTIYKKPVYKPSSARTLLYTWKKITQWIGDRVISKLGPQICVKCSARMWRRTGQDVGHVVNSTVAEGQTDRSRSSSFLEASGVASSSTSIVGSLYAHESEISSLYAHESEISSLYAHESEISSLYAHESEISSLYAHESVKLSVVFREDLRLNARTVLLKRAANRRSRCVRLFCLKNALNSSSVCSRGCWFANYFRESKINGFLHAFEIRH